MNTFYFNQRLSARILAAVALFSLVASLVPMQSFAGEPKVMICKKNNSTELSFTINNVNINAIGGLADSGINKDIVPPTLPDYPNGINWTVSYGAYTGQQIWENNCVVPTPPPATSTLTLVKAITGGVASLTSWILSAAGPTNISGVSGAVSVTNATVTPGSYTLSETGTVPNYTNGTTFSCVKVGGQAVSSNSLTLIDGDNATCTITNTYVPPAPTTGTIVVDKVTVPASDPQSFAFTTTGTGFTDFSLTDTSTPNSQATLVSGTYSVAEAAVAGWAQTSATCVSSTNGTEAPGVISLQAGEVVTCTFTNTKNAPGKGTIVVDKVTNPAADAQSFNFTTTGTGYAVFALTDTAVVNTQQLDPGTYSVSETATAGWIQTSAVCVSSTNGTEAPATISLQAGETVTCTYTNTKDTVPPPPATCTVTLVSDTSDFVVEKNANAQVLTFIHGAWTAMFGSASWIWGDNPVVLSTGDETQTFRKQFGFVGAVTGATLEVASDNGHVAALNGTATSTGGSTFNAPVSYNVTSAVAQGNNQLLIAVTNDGPVTDPKTNPAGLKYKLTINGTPTTDSDCAVPYVPPVDVCSNLDGNQATVPEGHTANDGICTQNGGGDNDELSCSITASDSSIRRGGDVTLNWSAIGAASATITGIDGVISLPGSKVIENLSSDTTYTMTVLGDYIGDSEVRESDTCSITVDTRSGGGGGGTRVNRTPSGNVLGASDSPKPLVLGDQVDAVPTGAPNTGKGGASTLVLGQLLAMPRRRNHS